MFTVIFTVMAVIILVAVSAVVWVLREVNYTMRKIR